MKPTFDHKASQSFLLWFDHELLSKGEAYKNVTSKLYPVGVYDGHFAYSAPFSQWVNDSSISGANVPDGIYVNGSFVPRGTSGLKLDYQHGRALFPLASGTVTGFQNVSGSYALKDCNIYYTTEDEKDVFFESKYHLRPKFSEQPTGIDTKMTFPAAFVKFNPNENTPHSLGGLEYTNLDFRVVVMTDNVYLLDGILSIFRDTNERVLPILEVSDLPWTPFGDVKSGDYNYYDKIANNNSNLLYITKARTLKLSEKVNTSVSDNVYGGIIDFDTFIIRQPRA